MFKVEEERDSLQVAIKLVVQDKHYQRENEAQPPVRNHIPHSHKKYPQEWNKVSLRRISSPRTKLLAARCECMHEHFHPITMLNS